MMKPPPLKWTSEITPAQVYALIRSERDIHKALLIFDSASATPSFTHDTSTFSLMLSRLASSHQFRPAERLLRLMSPPPSASTLHPLLLAYGRAHRPLDALRLFRSMRDSFRCEPSERSYVTVLSVLVDGNLLKLAHSFYREMKDANFGRSVAALNVLVKAFCRAERTLEFAVRVFEEMPMRGLEPDCYTYGTLINGFCRFGRIGRAKELFDEMGAKGLSPTVVTYSCLIHGLCLANDLGGAFDLFIEMKRRNVEPNVVTYSSLIDGLCKGGRSLEAMELVEEMGRRRISLNVITYSSLFHGLCLEGRIQEAFEILDRMRLQGFKPDAGMYGKLVGCLCGSRRFREAANYLDEMVLSGVSPNKVTRPVHVRMHNGVVRGLCEENDLNRAYSQYLCMQTRGVAVDAETFSCLVGCLNKAGDLNRAARVVEEMIGEGHAPDEGAWGEIVGAFWRQRKVQEEAVQVDWIERINDLINVQGEATEAEGDDLEFFISGLLSGREIQEAC
ncbi:Pentatricopeptide repeat-containing protein [Acorus gramineus]|uniref:Pentatricopeptide repeat-containing protein n=1 Tax=Acorus gramineus TaxID=55184 RepID=A0AAV9AXK9_ACOGR|nr:Pentatricopeptide repeat-containing protein [Acorus gramineus]